MSIEDELDLDHEPLALINGEPLQNIPGDLYIPPDALRVLLSSFSGPLDLLLYLIRKQNIDILNIPIAKITEQYMQYIAMIESCRLELAADYLLMAATLAEIKARLMLPPKVNEEGIEEEDPRMALVRRLQAYEEMKQQSDAIEQLPRLERDIFLCQSSIEDIVIIKPLPVLLLSQLVEAMNGLMISSQQFACHQITRERLSIKDRIAIVLDLLEKKTIAPFHQLYTKKEGPDGVVVSFLAILELAKQSIILISQVDTFSPIYIKANLDG